MRLTRRTFLQSALTSAAVLALPGWARAAFARPVRALSVRQLHTGESLSRMVYWAEGRYLPDALGELNVLLRDHRTGEAARMDTGVLDQLFFLQQAFGMEREIHIISGYRSPHTNAMLNARSSGVAKNSLHMQAKAIDLRIPGVALADLRAAALAMEAGGVGFYPKSDFVHVDTGRVRQWRGS